MAESLEHLELLSKGTFNDVIRGQPQHHLSSSSPRLPRLKILKIEEQALDETFEETWMFLLNHRYGTELDELIITGRGDEIEASLDNMMGACRIQSIKHLRLAKIRNLDDAPADLIISRFKRLRILDLEQTRITGVTVKRAVQRLPELKVLKIDGCREVSPDAVVWARSKGIEVTHLLKSLLHGGRF
ncbi:MAG: hypothetical protein M1828_003578 [Chrysothrix sp. TS-e1954]|nr:MAG: hypothetical protein M1828_003578 [Chrysothrix sp. TS-e1954]